MEVDLLAFGRDGRVRRGRLVVELTFGSVSSSLGPLIPFGGLRVLLVRRVRLVVPTVVVVALVEVVVAATVLLATGSIKSPSISSSMISSSFSSSSSAPSWLDSETGITSLDCA